ncbi:MAG TPA: superoxide dismutase family protein [Burkholderiales bacterium]|nr:superoxide dismutase family protein [Burkholderiales bacterium]
MMKRFFFGAGLAALTLTAANALAQDSAKAVFINTKGEQIGTATLTQTPFGVLIDVDVSGIPAGEHAFHVHRVGKCTPEDGFKSAGDHFNPGEHKHGVRVEGGPHAGDMMNQFVGSDGKLRAHVINTRISLQGGDGNLFDQDGSSLVVHAKGDDYKSQPAGNAGDRIACAVIERS